MGAGNWRKLLTWSTFVAHFHQLVDAGTWSSVEGLRRGPDGTFALLLAGFDDDLQDGILKLIQLASVLVRVHPSAPQNCPWSKRAPKLIIEDTLLANCWFDIKESFFSESFDLKSVIT